MRTKGRTRLELVVVAGLLALPPDRLAQATPGAPGILHRPGQSLAIIVNRSNPVTNLSFRELRKIFLGESSRWPNGRRIAVAMMDSEQPECRAVLRQIYRMDEDGYREHFLKGVFQGEIFQAPKTLASPAVMRKFVFNAPGAIGYVRISDVDSSVKVVRIDGHLPADEDYRLQIDEGSAK